MQVRLLLVRMLSLFALGVSAAQFADHITGAGSFCSLGDTCEDVTASVYGNPLGVPLSLVGLIGFGSLYALTLIPTQWGGRLVRLLGVLAGVAGIGLLVIQFVVLQKVCTLCLLVDSASIAIGVLAALGLPEPIPPSKFRLLALIMIAPVPLLAPVAWTAATMPDFAPGYIREHWVEGEINVVELSDFDCPHCQRADKAIREALSRHKVHFVRLVAPLPGHENAEPAARAYSAARQQGKGEEMAKALYEAESRSAARCREMAASLGLDLNEYDLTLKKNDIDVEFSKNRKKWSADGGKYGIPQMWVQDQLLRGVPSVQAIEEAIEKAKPPRKNETRH